MWGPKSSVEPSSGLENRFAFVPTRLMIFAVTSNPHLVNPGWMGAEVVGHGNLRGEGEEDAVGADVDHLRDDAAELGGDDGSEAGGHCGLEGLGPGLASVWDREGSDDDDLEGELLDGADL